MMKTLTSISLRATQIKNRQSERSSFSIHTTSPSSNLYIFVYSASGLNARMIHERKQSNINKQNLEGKDECKCSLFSNSS